MIYSDILIKAKEGNLVKLPNFEGIFKWDYGKSDLIFINNDFLCNAKDLNITNRDDFYYII